MVILDNFEDNCDTAITTANKSKEFDLKATKSCVLIYKRDRLDI